MAHAEGLYKRARKLRRAVDAIQPLMEAVQQELDYLETVCDGVSCDGKCRCADDV